ncbi:MAG: hypothetical protein NT038_04985 [Euryarchaeota archaeon]|nr:hypothetical protein [Euryarchaeota archaeon]
MNKKILIGSIAVVFLILFVLFKPTVDARSLTKDSTNKLLKNKIICSPGHFIDILLMLIYGTIVLIFAILGYENHFSDIMKYWSP